MAFQKFKMKRETDWCKRKRSKAETQWRKRIRRDKSSRFR